MAKCYIIQCAVCGLLTDVTRRDAVTCSSRCRVRLHRNPRILDPIRQLSQAWDVKLFQILEAGAIREVTPDLSTRISACQSTVAEVRSQVVQAYFERLWEAVESANSV
jgi:hypothetical protein